MSGKYSLIGLDWGTSSLRAWRFAGQHQPLDEREHPWGIMKLPSTAANRDAAFQETFDNVCADWLAESPACPVIACGMIGSTQGWQEASYSPCPVKLSALATDLQPVIRNNTLLLHIIPGVVKPGKLPEVMRGEETQIFGALMSNDELKQANAQGTCVLIGLPGTHSKWACVQRSAITDFRTFMTGEIFDALTRHTILGATLIHTQTPQWDAFMEGLAIARTHHDIGLLNTLFSTRTRFLTAQLSQEQQADYLSGLIIGHEMCGLGNTMLKNAPSDMPVALIGNDVLCERYYRAFTYFFADRPLHIIKHATEGGLWHIAQTAGLLTSSTRKSSYGL